MWSLSICSIFLFSIPKVLQNFLSNNQKDSENVSYADNLIIDTFNLENLITYDVSNHEKPTKVVNFNHLINNPDKLDAFYDGGSLQHTFNIQNVLKNISNHVKIGGSIIHVCSSNNLCGFGFYQFSPEFFLNYYTKENGFINISIHLSKNKNFLMRMKRSTFNH